MQIVPLYTPAERRAAADVAMTPDQLRVAASPACRRCMLGGAAKTTCMPAAKVPRDAGPTLLVIGDKPSSIDDSAGAPFSSYAAQDVCEQIERLWSGPVVYDYAVRCMPTTREFKGDKITRAIQACRPFTAQHLHAHKPARILLLGTMAFRSVLGRSPEPGSVRRGYSFLADGTPVFLAYSLEEAEGNDFVRAWLASDIEWALTCAPPQHAAWDAEVSVVRSRADALRACEFIRSRGRWAPFDLETSGVFGDAYF